MCFILGLSEGERTSLPFKERITSKKTLFADVNIQYNICSALLQQNIMTSFPDPIFSIAVFQMSTKKYDIFLQNNYKKYIFNRTE